MKNDLSRREVLTALGALGLGAAMSGTAHAVEAEETAEIYGMDLSEARPFSPDLVMEKARALSKSPYRPIPRISEEWSALNYDQFRGIWFDTRHSLWRGEDSAAQIEFFPTGSTYVEPVVINAVADGQMREVQFHLRNFDTTDQFPKLSDEGNGFSGFRVLGEVEREGQFQEYAVFQGASYFRAIARGQAYGISARGLALNTGSSQGEEFPIFREFWVEKPARQGETVTVHALLDSPSVSGAYRFVIDQGNQTVMDIEFTLFPRKTIDQVGIAPGTSMFLFDQTNRARFDDFRDAVHDSDGLLMMNGNGELLWRPLNNPVGLGVSYFSDNGTRGFGLMQRSRGLDDFGDLHAHYERRPSLWVEPRGEWGPGHVILFEIPADKEIYDNIVAFWRPEQPLEAGQEYSYAYRLHWCDDAPIEGDVARVIDTRTGKRIFQEGRLFTIDFAPHPGLGVDPAALTPRVRTNRGEITGAIVQMNPATGGMRLAFTLVAPEDVKQVELRAELLREDARVSEIWLNRWMAS